MGDHALRPIAASESHGSRQFSPATSFPTELPSH